MMFGIMGFFSRLLPGSQSITMFGYEAVWLDLSLITFVFAYFGLFNSDLLALNMSPIKYDSSYQPDSFYEDLKFRLDDVIQKDEPYLNPKLTLLELSGLLNCNPLDLSRIINKNMK